MQQNEKRGRSRELTRVISGILDSGATAVLATVVDGPFDIGAKLLVESSGSTTGTLDDRELERAIADFAQVFLSSRRDSQLVSLSELLPQAAGQILFERIQPEPRLVICGAGHVGASLAKLACAIGYGVTLIDDRAEFVSRERFPEDRIEVRAARDWGATVRDAVGNGRGVSVAIVTRGHNEDEECLRAVMTTEPDYVGLIGSKRRTNIVLERLRSAGFDDNRVRNVRAPIGLDIGAVTPEEVALSILAEIVSVRRGGLGGSLSAWRRVES